MSTIVRLGPEYFPDPTRGRPISSGDLYIGEPDLDPEIVSNQIDVTAVQESGNTVTISQPISTSAGGVPLYNGSPVTLTVDESYSLKLLDSYGSQVYYTPNSFVQGTSTEILYLSDFSCDLSSAISTIGATVTTLVVDCDAIIADGTTETIPSTLLLDIIKGGSIDGVSGGGTETLVFSGLNPRVGDYQVFLSNLTVTGLTVADPVLFGDNLNRTIVSLGSTNPATLNLTTDVIIADGGTSTITDNITINPITGSIDGVAGGGTETLNINGPINPVNVQFLKENLTLGGSPIIDKYLAVWTGVSTGSSDNTDALQQTLDWMANGGVLSIPGGNYEIAATMDIPHSGIEIRGAGADSGRSAWGNWPTRIYTNELIDIFEIDVAGVGNIRGVKFTDLVLDGQEGVGTTGVRVSINCSDGRFTNVVLRNLDDGVLQLGGSTGWVYQNVNFFNIRSTGADLTESNHRTTFRDCIASTTEQYNTGLAVVRIGSSAGHCSNVNFYGCDFEHRGMAYQIDARHARALNISGGYMEGLSDEVVSNAFIRLGSVSNGGTVLGGSMTGVYIGFDAINYAFRIEDASGFVIEGNDFKNMNSAEGIILNPEVGTVFNMRYGVNAIDAGAEVYINHAAANGFATGGPVQLKIFDDAIAKVEMNEEYGMLDVFAHHAALFGGNLLIDSSGTGGVDILSSHGTVNTYGTALTGTTGADNSLNIGIDAATNIIYIENRIGALYQFTIEVTVAPDADL